MTGKRYVPTIAEASRDIAGGAFSPVELTEACLARIDEFDGKVSAFHHVMRDSALETAHQAETEIKAGNHRGPMHGIPIALKAVLDVEGQVTTGNSRRLRDYLPKQDATVVRRLKDAGAVILGHVDTFEFAFGGPAFDVLFPPAHNPWGLDRSTGGSSSGSGASVAAGFCLGAIGSDAGGSIRQPAGLCGIAGLKPTLGRVSAAGDIPLTFSLDTVGPMCWTAEDCALMLQAIAGHDPRDPLTSSEPVDDYVAGIDKGVAGLKIGMIRHFYENDHRAHDEVIAVVNQAGETLAGLGAEVVAVELSNLHEFHAAGRMIVPAEAFAIHEGFLSGSQGDAYGELLRNRLMLGSLIRAVDYIQAQRRRSDFVTELEAVFADYDVLLTADMLVPQPVLADKQVFPFFDVPIIHIPFNLTGHPALSVCAGFFEDGMPISVQIAGRYFDEATVLRVGHAFEQATPWREHRPDFAG